MNPESAGKTTQAERLKELTDKLEQGVRDLFCSERFKAYLRTAARFHRYSVNNVLLIALQYPGASRIAGFQAWKKNFGRTVRKGEKGIRILAPCPYEKLVERDKLDPETRQPVLDEHGDPIREQRYEKRQAFKIVTVFDVSQTEGKELPSLVQDLSGCVDHYAALTAALEDLSPVPIRYEAPFSQTAKGCYSPMEQCVYVRPGMSQAQTLKTLIHEISHAKLHAVEVKNGVVKEMKEKDQNTREVEAESVAYVVCQRFGVDTSDYSFGYVAGWSKGRELEELKSSLECIRSTAKELIDGVEQRCPELFPKSPQPDREKTQDEVER